MEFDTFLRRTGERIRKARWLAGLTQEEGSARSGLTYRHFAELERGRVNPSLRTLLDLALVLGRTVAELVDVEPGSRRGRVGLDEAVATPPKRGRKRRRAP